MPIRKRALVAAMVALLSEGGCLLIRDIDALGARTATSDGGSEGGDAHEVDASDEGSGDAGVDAEPPCPGEAGPRMVRVDSYCIDATEVSVAQYRAFLNAREADAGGQRAACAWNTTFVPKDGIPSIDFDALPVVNVDFCDAVAYCEWAGKRLCGKIGGGAIAIDELANPLRSQWYRACSREGTIGVPYGTYDPLVCNGADRDAGGLLPVGSQPRCEGGYPGIFDLSGNVREWEDACDDGVGQEKRCLVRGGAFYDIASTLDCANEQRVRIDEQNPGFGFRCCAP